MKAIHAKSVLKYAILPGIFPRLRQFFTSSFGYTAFLMAYVYNMVRLLPDQHPYLQPVNIGKFTIYHVIAAAANNLVLKKQNIDQIVIFILILTGIVLLGLMILAVLVSFIFGYAFAQTLFFTTPEPRNDIAFMLLDQVFGVPDFFKSCVSTGVACFPGQTPAAFPWPFHVALQQMFRFYSSGIFFIGMLIFLYFLVVIVVETATSGTPFGQRFKNMWIPVRLVVAIGLLIPLSYGYNSAQYIVFGAAKFGSSFATNAWLLYNRSLENSGAIGMGPGTSNPTGETTTLVALPRVPDMAPIAQMMSLVHTCAFAHWYENDEPKQKTRENMPDDISRYQRYRLDNKIKPYMVKNIQHWMLAPGGLVTDQTNVTRIYNETTYEQAMGFYGRSDIVIRFGKLNDQDRDGVIDDDENVEPLCGDVRIKIGDVRLEGDEGVSGKALPGSVEIQKLYFELIKSIWFDRAKADDYLDFAGRSYLLSISLNNEMNDACSMGCAPPNRYLPSCGGNSAPCRTDPIGAEWKQNAISELEIEFESKLKTIWMDYNDNNVDSYMKPEVLKYGWGGAGIWFNKIAQFNGAFATAVANHPRFDVYPLVMEKVREYRKKTDNLDGSVKQFDPSTSQRKPIDYGNEVGPSAESIAIGLYNVHQYWNKESANMANSEKQVTSSAVETAMNFLFGTKGLFAMTSENTHIHPLAQLVALGKNLVDNAIGAVAGSTFLSAMGGLSKAFDNNAGPFMNAASGLILSTAFIGLTAGIVLYYVVPFLPFLFFYFAVASWVKSIFEAMVGVPLWALAHLRLDGEGLPGGAAANGYFLILEIFLRPIMTVIAMIGALIIFAAQVRILNFIWLLVTSNAGGFNDDSTINIIANIDFKRTIVDQFFFTILYAILVYMLAIASFKLIDRIPDDILRWMSSSASSFSDINQNTVEQISSKVSLGGMTAGDKIAGGLQQLGGGLGSAAGDAIRQAAAPSPPKT